ncbi:hypothetical protein CK203_110400 [Vitis vinifera]|uniref:Uncharacterized protein n=1 Tax=Vitis vinifera TaxID=29760 RepID=A0A438BPC0_VITVI|nr:hypothetical protein CK203_110400 [Vitis vinifera]
MAMISWWMGPFIIHDMQSNGVVELLNFKSTRTFKVGSLKNETRFTRENRGEKPRHGKIRTTQFSGANFAPPTPLCEITFVSIFQSMLSHALCLGEPQECENFALHYSPYEKFALVL